MGTLASFDAARAARAARGRATLQVALEAREELESGRLAVDIEVTGGRVPVRLYLYLDGDLVDSWVDTRATWEIPFGARQRARHAVTARAVDAQGRWAGASLIVDGVKA